MKVCARCAESKPLDQFYKRSKNRIHEADGFLPNCIECTLSYNKKKLKTGTTKNNDLRKRYGITLKDYNRMLSEQDYGCKICGKSEKENGRKLAVDHCHATGKVRGILCTHCNSGLGYFQDNQNRMQAAIHYLDTFSDSVLTAA